jgi:hypothetical protein
MVFISKSNWSFAKMDIVDPMSRFEFLNGRINYCMDETLEKL